MTVTRQQVKQLLKGRLSGRETAILVLQDAWEKDHGRDGFLTDTEIQRLKQQLKLPQEINTYNSLIELYRIMGYTLQGIRISALETVRLLEGVSSLLIDAYLLTVIREQQARAPVVMTEKQYQDLKAKQRETLLQTISSLGEALAFRAFEQASPEQQKEAGAGGGDDMWMLAVQEPGLLCQAVSTYQELIQAGALKPVILTEQQIQRYQEAQRLEERAGQQPPPEHVQRLLDWYKEQFPEDQQPGADSIRPKIVLSGESQILRELYQEGLRRWSQRHAQRVLAGLETLKQHPELIDSDKHPELDWLISWTCLSGEQLYQAGLPEQVQWVDTYKPGLFDGLLEGQIAILLEPARRDVDEAGHYKGQGPLGLMEEILTLPNLEQRLKQEGSSVTGFLQELTTGARNKIRDFLASQAVTEAVSKAVEIPFTEDTEADFGMIQQAADRFNLLAKGESQLPYLPEGLRLSQIRIARMRPKQETVQYLRERVALALGDRWWQEIKDLEQSFEDDLHQEED